MKYQSIYNITDILTSAVVTALNGALDILTTGTLLKKLLGKLPWNLYNRVSDKLINDVEPEDNLKPDRDSNPSSDSKELDSLFERLRKAYERLLELLRDSSKEARAKLRELYEYISGLFEELRRMGPDWASDPLKALALLLIAIIIIAIVAVLPGVVNTEQKREELEELRVAKLNEAQALKRAARHEQARELIRLRWKLELIDGMEKARLRPWVQTPWEHMVKQQIEIEVETIKCRLMF